MWGDCMPSQHPLLIFVFALSTLFACKRESVTLNERRAVCGPEASARADDIALLPVLDGLPRPFRPETAKGTLLFEDGQKLSISSFLGQQGCLFVPRNRAWVLVATDVSPNGLIGVTIENSPPGSRHEIGAAQKGITSLESTKPDNVHPVSAQIVANAAHFEMCGNDISQRDAKRWLPVSVGSGSRYPGFVLSSLVLNIQERSHPKKRWKASAHSPSPLGCIEVRSDRLQFVSVSTQQGIFAQSLGNEVATTSVIVLARTTQPDVMRDCLASTNSIAETAFQKGKIEAFALTDVWDPTAMARGRICADASCSPLSSSGKGSDHLVFGRCLLVPQTAANAFARRTLQLETREADGYLYVSKSIPMRAVHSPRTSIHELGSTKVASAKEWKASSLFGIRGCSKELASEVETTYRRPQQAIAIEQRSLFPTTHLKTATVRARAISLVTGTSISKDHLTVLGTTDAELRLALASVSAESLGVVPDSGEDFELSFSLAVEDVVGQVIELEPAAACRVVIVSQDRTKILPEADEMSVVLESGRQDFLDLREIVSRTLTAPHVRISYRIAAREDKPASEPNCLLDDGWTSLPAAGLIRAPSVGRWALHLQACDPVGNVSLVSIPVISDQILPDFDLSFASSVENPDGFAILRDPVKDLLIDLSNLSDDVFSFSQLLESLQCESSLSVDSLETESISKCEVIEQDEATKHARLRVQLPRLSTNAFLRIGVSVATGRQTVPRLHRRIGARIPSQMDMHWQNIFEYFPDPEGPIAIGDAGWGRFLGLGRDGAIYLSSAGFDHWSVFVPPSTVNYPRNGQHETFRLPHFFYSSDILEMIDDETVLVNFELHQLLCTKNEDCRPIPDILELEASSIKSCKAKSHFLFCLVEKSASGGRIELISYHIQDAQSVVLSIESFARSAEPFRAIMDAHQLGEGVVNLGFRSDDSHTNLIFDSRASLPVLKSLSHFLGTSAFQSEINSSTYPIQDFKSPPYFFETSCGNGFIYFKADGAGTVDRSDCILGGERGTIRDGQLFAAIRSGSDQGVLAFMQWSEHSASKPVTRKVSAPSSDHWTLIGTGRGHFVFEGKDTLSGKKITSVMSGPQARVTILDPSVAEPAIAAPRKTLSDVIRFMEDGTPVFEGWRIPSQNPGARVSLGDNLLPKMGETPRVIFANAFPGAVIRFYSPARVFIRWTDGELSRVHESFISCLNDIEENTNFECVTSASFWLHSIPETRRANLLAFVAEHFQNSKSLFIEGTTLCASGPESLCLALELTPVVARQLKRALEKIFSTDAKSRTNDLAKSFIEVDSVWTRGLIPFQGIIGSALASLGYNSKPFYDVFALRDSRGLLAFRPDLGWGVGHGCFENYRIDTTSRTLSPASEPWFCTSTGASDYSPIQMLAEVEEGRVLAFQSSINRSSYYPPESDSKITPGFYFLYKDGMMNTNIISSSAQCEAQVIPFAKSLLAYSLCEPRSGPQLLLRGAIEKP